MDIIRFVIKSYLNRYDELSKEERERIGKAFYTGMLLIPSMNRRTISDDTRCLLLQLQEEIHQKVSSLPGTTIFPDDVHLQ